MTEFTKEVQRLFIEMMLSEAMCYSRVQNIYNPENFDRSLHKIATFIKEFSQKYNAVPSFEQINAIDNQELKPIENVAEAYIDWFLDEFEKFTKRQELERAILRAADHLEKGEYEPVEKLIKDAVQVGLTRDLGTNYYESPKERLMKIRESSGEIKTGWDTLDAKLYGGWARGTLNVVAGASGTGKSIFLQNWALNLSLQGLVGAYITLELSEELCAMRVDAMLTEQSTKSLFKNLDDTELKVKMQGKRAGALVFKMVKAQSTVNDIRAFLKEWEIANNKKFDFICVDYLDLLMPATVKVDPSNMFIKDKYVSEELRNLAIEQRAVCLTASQLNRSSIDEVEINFAHISGGLSKINSSDNVFAIYTSRAMKERGRYQLQLIKTRSSSGVGSKIDLAYDVDTMRLSDLGEDAPMGGISPNALVKQLQAKSTVTSPNKFTEKKTEIIDPETGEIVITTSATPNISGEVQSFKVKEALADIRAGKTVIWSTKN